MDYHRFNRRSYKSRDPSSANVLTVSVKSILIPKLIRCMSMTIMSEFSALGRE
jgi:hypothetical protein